MRILSLVLIAALAVFFAACSKQRNANPSIADTSAKQTQPADDQTASIDSQDQSAANNADQSQGATQDQAGVNQDQTPNDQANNQSNALNSTTPPAEGFAPNDQNSANAAGDSNPSLDQSQTSQAQIPGLPESNTATPNTNGNNASAGTSG